MIIEIPEEQINDLQKRSIVALSQRAKGAHYTDIWLRINGDDERYEADWLKHIKILQSTQDAK